MVDLNFPTQPVIGTVYLGWMWDGLKWRRLSNTDGSITDAPIDGTTYARNNAAWAHLTHSDITDWTANVPVASSTTPLMDGPAAVGTGTAFARNDHVHPVDTSRAPLASPAFTGVPTTAATPAPGDNTTKLATTAFVGAAVTAGGMGDNRIINGNFAVNQRAYVNLTALVAGAYGHDRWKAGASGCTYTFLSATIPDTLVTITAGTLIQIIEAGMIEGGVYTLSWTGSATARVYQGTPTGSYAASPLITASLTAGTDTIVEFNAVGSLTRVKLEIGSVATPFNRQSMAKSMADCQRYYQNGGTQYYAYNSAGSLWATAIYLPVWMRAAPTIVYTPTLSGNTTGVALSGSGPGALGYSGTTTALGNFTAQGNFTASAEL